MIDNLIDLYPKRAPNLASRVLNGEVILMNPADSALFSLNETATLIWLAADGTRTLREIVECEVCPRFDVAPETALREAGEFAGKLAKHSVLHLAADAKGTESPWNL